MTVFPAVDNVDLAGMPLHGSTGLSTNLCAGFPGNQTNMYCSSFGALSPLEVEYTFDYGNGTTVSAWVPMSIRTKSGPFINENCKPNPKNPTAPVCVNGSIKANYNIVEAPATLPKTKTGPRFNFTQVITGVRYAWHLGCCPSGQSVCPPNSCPIRGWNSTLPAPGFHAKIVDGKCKCTLPQVCG